jgi:hypothetical protein
MAIDVNHQLRINYLLRNGARAIRIPIGEALKMKENDTTNDVYMLIHSNLEQEM